MWWYAEVCPEQQHVSVIPSYPAKIIHIDMDQYPNGLSLNKGSWMATIGTDAEFGVECAPSVVAACCAGQGCCITTFKGKGSSFINAGGTVMIRHLGAGESVTVDTLGLVAWENGVKLDAKCTGDCLMMCCGGSGMYNTELTGPGLVVVQSMSRERAAWAYVISPYSPCHPFHLGVMSLFPVVLTRLSRLDGLVDLNP